MKKFGGTFSIQDLLPTRIIGALRASVSEAELGQLYVNFYQEPKLFWLKHHGEQIHLVVSKALAVHLLGLLEVQARVIARLRETPFPGRPPRDGGSAKLMTVEANGDAMIVSWPSGLEGIEQTIAAEEADLRIREDLVWDMASGLADELARMAALP